MITTGSYKEKQTLINIASFSKGRRSTHGIGASDHLTRGRVGLNRESHLIAWSMKSSLRRCSHGKNFNFGIMAAFLTVNKFKF